MRKKQKNWKPLSVIHPKNIKKSKPENKIIRLTAPQANQPAANPMKKSPGIHFSLQHKNLFSSHIVIQIKGEYFSRMKTRKILQQLKYTFKYEAKKLWNHKFSLYSYQLTRCGSLINRDILSNSEYFRNITALLLLNYFIQQKRVVHTVIESSKEAVMDVVNLRNYAEDKLDLSYEHDNNVLDELDERRKMYEEVGRHWYQCPARVDTGTTEIFSIARQFCEYQEIQYKFNALLVASHQNSVSLDFVAPIKIKNSSNLRRKKSNEIIVKSFSLHKESKHTYLKNFSEEEDNTESETKRFDNFSITKSETLDYYHSYFPSISPTEGTMKLAIRQILEGQSLEERVDHSRSKFFLDNKKRKQVFFIKKALVKLKSNVKLNFKDIGLSLREMNLEGNILTHRTYSTPRLDNTPPKIEINDRIFRFSSLNLFSIDILEIKGLLEIEAEEDMEGISSERSLVNIYNEMNNEELFRSSFKELIQIPEYNGEMDNMNSYDIHHLSACNMVKIKKLSPMNLSHLLGNERIVSPIIFEGSCKVDRNVKKDKYVSGVT